MQVLQAAQLMVEHQATSLLVKTDTPSEGILTQDDVLTCQKVRLKEIQVEDLKIQPTPRVNEDLTCEDAIKIMITRGCRKLVVTNAEQNQRLFTLDNILDNKIRQR